MLVRSSLSETVRHILSRMFINSVLSQYSFVGQKKKLAFSSLNSCSVIFGKHINTLMSGRLHNKLINSSKMGHYIMLKGPLAFGSIVFQ